MARDDILIRLRAVGADLVDRQARKAAKAIAQAGKQSRAAGQEMKRQSTSVEKYGWAFRDAGRAADKASPAFTDAASRAAYAEKMFGAAGVQTAKLAVATDGASAAAGKGTSRWRRLTTVIGQTTEKATKGNTALHGMARSAAGLVVGLASIRGAQAAVGTVEDLAKASLALQRNAGFDVQTANQWASLLQSRGVAVKALTTSVVTLGRTQQAAARQAATYRLRMQGLRVEERQLQKATATTAAQQASLQARREKLQRRIEAARTRGPGQALAQLGLTSGDLKGDTQTVLMRIADGMKALPKGANRAALAQKLLGRAGVQMLPILNLGSDGIREQTELLDRYGAVISAKTPAQVAELIKAQRQMKIAQMGLSVSLGQTLLPLMVKVTGVLPGIVRDVQEGNGAWGVLGTVLRTAGGAIGAVAGFLERNETVAKILMGTVIALTAAIGVWTAVTKVHNAYTTVAATLQKALAKETLIGSAAAKVAAAAQWLWNAALSANPIVLVVAGIAALAVGAVVAYRRFGWFRAGVQAAWGVLKTGFGWLRKHWPLLLAIITGPIGIATLIVVRNFRRITGAGRSVLDWFRSLPGRIASVVKSIPAVMERVAGDAVRAFARGVDDALAKIPGSGGLRRLLHFDVPDTSSATFGPGGGIRPNPNARRATGGVTRRGELTLVGERGPELARFPGGTSITPAARTRQLLTGAGEVVVPVTLMLDGKVLHRAVVRAERRHMAVR